QVVRRQKAIAEKEELTKEKAKAAGERKRKALAKKKAEQERKRKLEQEASAASPNLAGGSADGVVEVGKDGAFDVDQTPMVRKYQVGTSNVVQTGVAAGDMKAAVAAVAAGGGLSAVGSEDGAADKQEGGGEGKGDGAKGDDGEGNDGDDDDTPPPIGNGGRTEKYEWTQTLQELSVVVPIPEGLKSRDIVCDITKSRLRVGVRGQPLLVDGEMYNKVKVDDSFWTLEDGKEVNIALQKENQMEWWKCVVKGDPEINTAKVR
ncbi:unnamed protein product, partial [Laminaria digitata]